MTADLKTRALVAAENCESEGWDESGRAVRDLVDRLTVAEEYVVHRNRQIDEQNARLAAAERVVEAAREEARGQAENETPWVAAALPLGRALAAYDEATKAYSSKRCDTCGADAELLAAAPDLYEALSALVKAEWMVTHDWGGDRPAVLAKAEAVLARLQDALFPVSETHRTTEGVRMMMVIDTYVVKVSGNGMSGDVQTYRVPQTDLDTFVRVLNFNRREYEVKKEPSPLDPQSSAMTGRGIKLT